MSKTPSLICYAQTTAGSHLPLRARIIHPTTDVPVVSADVAAISRTIDGGEPETLEVGDVIREELATWRQDGIGYNFADACPGQPAGTYRVVYGVEFTGGFVHNLIWATQFVS